ncbi:MAG: hypothetical protein R3C53_06995 [Pirellulaceae bacterium]
MNTNFRKLPGLYAKSIATAQGGNDFDVVRSASSRNAIEALCMLFTSVHPLNSTGHGKVQRLFVPMHLMTTVGSRNRQDVNQLLPRCSALFIDEAQDMGPSTLRLLLSIVEQSDEGDANSRSAHIFFDNAQNVYGTKTPKWSDFGLDMRGRSTIMRESFRSTTPITELAVNVLNLLSDENDRKDQQELLALGLLEPARRNGQDWLHVRFNQIDGPKPIFHTYDHRSAEMAGLAKHLKYLVRQESISPQDICLIYNGRAQQILESELKPLMGEIGVELSVQKNRPFERQANTLVATTAHSYKGYESEVVMIPCVDHFIAPEGKILANSLYVAMTRARSLLGIYGVNGGSSAAQRLQATIFHCIQALNSTPH